MDLIRFDASSLSASPAGRFGKEMICKFCKKDLPEEAFTKLRAPIDGRLRWKACIVCLAPGVRYGDPKGPRLTGDKERDDAVIFEYNKKRWPDKYDPDVVAANLEKRRLATIEREEIKKVARELFRESRRESVQKDREFYYPEKEPAEKQVRGPKKVNTLDEFFKLRIEQCGGECEICGGKTINTDGSESRLSIDHSHTTNKLRGLLCRNCKFGIGFMKDRTDLLFAAIRYLEKNDG